MKRIILLLLASIMCFVSCYDDTELRESIKEHENRLDKLELLCSQMNTNITGIEKIVQALEQKDYVISVTPVKNEGQEIGYNITFSKSGTITIYHGTDGVDGQDGADGQNGVDGQTPRIGVKVGSDGIYYWTLDDQWLLDDAGHKVVAGGKNGSDGKDGQTPELKIQDGFWYVRYGTGEWNKLGPAIGGQGDTFFQKVTHDDKEVTFVLSDGSTIVLPMKQKLSIVCTEPKDMICLPSTEVKIPFTLIGGSKDVKLECMYQSGWKAVAETADGVSGTLTISVPDSFESGKVMLLVTDGDHMDIASFMIEKGVVRFGPGELYVSKPGGTLDFNYSSNIDVKFVIPVEASSWLSLVESKTAFTEHQIQFFVEANTNSEPRSTDVQLIDSKGNSAAVLTVYQEGKGEIYYEPDILDADQMGTIYFHPYSSSEFNDYQGDLYVYTGLVVDEEWTCIKADWMTNTPECRMEKMGENLWKLDMKPTIREFYNAANVSVQKLALVIRSADGRVQTSPDFYCEVNDRFNKPFVPDDVIYEPVPAGMSYGINYNPDHSVTFVLKEKDKLGNNYDNCFLVGDFTGWKRDNAYVMRRDEAMGCWWYTIPASEIDPDKEYLFRYWLSKDNNLVKICDPYSEIVYDYYSDKHISSTTYPDLPQLPSNVRGLVSAFKVNKDVYNWQISDFSIQDENHLVIYELLLRDFTASGDLKEAMSKLDYLSALGINAIELMPVQEFDGNDSWGYDVNNYFALDKAYGTRTDYKRFIDECHKRGIAVIFDVVYNHATSLNAMAGLYWENNHVSPVNPWFNVVAPHQLGIFNDWNHQNPEVRDFVKRNLRYLLQEYRVDGFRFDLSMGFTQNQGTDSFYDAERVSVLKEYNDQIKSVNPNAVTILEHSVEPENEELGKAGMKIWKSLNFPFMESGQGGNPDLSDLGAQTSTFGTFVSYMESHDEERTLLQDTRHPAPSWGIVGTFNNWGETPDIVMISSGSYYLVENVRFEKQDEFKIRYNNEWENNYGAFTPSYSIVPADEYLMEAGGGNFMVDEPGNYDVYFQENPAKIWLKKHIAENVPSGSFIPSFNVTELGLRMSRGALNAAFFLTTPGPKMIWQFGELGYDISIMYGGDRASRKPVHWDYYDIPDRKSLYDVYSKLLSFRKNCPRFFDADAVFTYHVQKADYPCKQIVGRVDGQMFMLIGNFSSEVVHDCRLDFPASGTWKSLFDESLIFERNSGVVELPPYGFLLLKNF